MHFLSCSPDTLTMEAGGASGGRGEGICPEALWWQSSSFNNWFKLQPSFQHRSVLALFISILTLLFWNFSKMAKWSCKWPLINSREHSLSFPDTAICNCNWLFKENELLNYKVMHWKIKWNQACGMNKGYVSAWGACVWCVSCAFG